MLTCGHLLPYINFVQLKQFHAKGSVLFTVCVCVAGGDEHSWIATRLSGWLANSCALLNVNKQPQSLTRGTPCQVNNVKVSRYRGLDCTFQIIRLQIEFVAQQVCQLSVSAPEGSFGQSPVAGDKKGCHRKQQLVLALHSAQLCSPVRHYPQISCWKRSCLQGSDSKWAG